MTDAHPRVVVAMSGGVDSSVAAALLIEQGYRVVGMMLRLWSEEGQEAQNRCCAPEAVDEARRVAGMLRIPFYVIDARERFKQVVVQDFLEGYSSGRTPNPCIICNREIRWGFLLEQALAIGGSYMATGHYARLNPTEEGKLELLCAVDHSKDQSYVLSELNQMQLEHSLFPLGEMTKVHELGLPVADKPDSQDLCFLGDMDYRNFLARHAPQAVMPGEIVNRQGQVLGRHQGLPFYTIGQRKGLGVHAAEPYYVLDRDLENNRLVAGTESELGKSEMRVAGINWVSGSPPATSFRAEVKIRYRASLAGAQVFPEVECGARVVFYDPLRDITPGQQAVFYQGDLCLGGGEIVR
jgi:tRNA-specific 2-thiouridylase